MGRVLRFHQSMAEEGTPMSPSSNPSDSNNQAEAVKLLRERLEWLRARYDSGAVSPATYAIIRMIEIDLAWREHGRARS
jgi:hypothetical protein